MKQYMTRYIIIALTAISTAACSDYLDVRPYDKIAEDDLFATETGFQRLLNGIYIDLNSDALYARTLTVETAELLAYDYAFGDNPTYWGDYTNLRNRNFNSDYWRNRLNATWDKAYALILNCNTILENMEERQQQPGFFTADNYNLIRGEALAMRAMLHFDMFRLFGPVYKINPTAASIPYCTSTNRQIQELLPAREVVERLMDDLAEAERLLANDPIRSGGALEPAGPNEPLFTAYRGLRLNYYAVHALMARVCYYAAADETSEKADYYAQEAIAHARTVIDSRRFPFVDRALVLGSPDNPDRIFHTECIFSLTNTSRGLLFKNNFDPQLNPRPFFRMEVSSLETIYFGGEYGGSTDDYRYIANWSKTGDAYYFYKFADLPDVSLLRNTMIPMIRLGEMYLIMADLQTDRTDKAYWLNQLRAHRGVGPMDAEKLYNAVLGYEFVRELYGEGQVFYYYKRNYRSIVSKFDNAGDVTVPASEKLYVIPLPDTETENRQ